ncbi:TraR/DksA family transcriptional regulator [Vibrio parahaemolyticus]|uniref:TraR/DksA family transcriptional regulator n=1 Tax=Vibrio parahaemolyticus TaxID=670 RepID=A0A7Y0S570_VIBPH|nr:TraR/DksA C4-type zinc finger protein [Vibrio parahaemolyticus]AKU57570.1 molecular chaperone DnaK [Vibrio parahaemolyticus]APE86629.1 molecular chaperone DnaK [Vibrio parahaemolyticus]EGQ7792769.1 TraR/DksA family transcriptional regulator [Vibrio parahaemolyticus]EGQ7809335.1 TraR/DksA family transcriptional regulator [Vibrio parahaemolyticus]EGQ8533239.1 TraR/DksA family transcriptional regulator [Vibrio parahaemolyticus]
MSDVIDHASGLETQFTEVAIANQLARAKQMEQRESAQECGVPIPEERRQKVPGCKYCTQCQSNLERFKR